MTAARTTSMEGCGASGFEECNLRSVLEVFSGYPYRGASRLGSAASPSRSQPCRTPAQNRQQLKEWPSLDPVVCVSDGRSKQVYGLGIHSDLRRGQADLRDSACLLG